MEGKQCQCYAIRLLDTMTKAYEYWLDNPERGEKMLASSARDILFHLNEEFKEGEYTEKQEPYYSLLEEMRSALSKYDSGTDSGVHAMEIVRNRIHANDELKQLMVCGTPYKGKESLTETAKILSDVFNAIEETTPKEARSILDKQYEKITCSSE